MVHIEKGQKIPQNEDLIVYSPTGDYDEEQLIECGTISQPDFAVCAYQAQFVKYGSIVYRFNTSEELGAELIKVDPSSNHKAVADYKYEENRKRRKGLSTIDPTQNAILSSAGSKCLADYDLSTYAADPLHVQKISIILSSMGSMNSVSDIDNYITQVVSASPLTGEMFFNASQEYNIDCRLLMAIAELESRFGTLGVAVKTLNPGNVGNTGTATRTYSSWQAGLDAVADWLDKHRINVVIDQVNQEPVVEQISDNTPPAEEPPVQNDPPPTEGEVLPEIVPPTEPPLDTPTSTEPIVVPPEEPIKMPVEENPIKPAVEEPLSKAKKNTSKLLAKLNKNSKKIIRKSRA